MLTRWYVLTTEGSCDNDDNKFLHILLRHIDKDSGLIATSLFRVPNINSGSTAQQVNDVWNEVSEAFSLHWDNCITFSSDNTKSMIGQRNTLLQKI